MWEEKNESNGFLQNGASSNWIGRNSSNCYVVIAMSDLTKRDELADAYCSKIETEDDYQKDALSFKAGYDAGVANLEQQNALLKESVDSLNKEVERLKKEYDRSYCSGYKFAKDEADHGIARLLIHYHTEKDRAEKLAAALEISIDDLAETGLSLNGNDLRITIDAVMENLALALAEYRKGDSSGS